MRKKRYRDNRCPGIGTGTPIVPVPFRFPIPQPHLPRPYLPSSVVSVMFSLLTPILILQLAGQPVAGVVNADTIALEFYAREVGRKAELNATVGTATAADIMQQTWNALVEDVLLRQEAKRLGLDVSDRFVDSVLVFAPPDFVRRSVVDAKGRFDPQLMKAMLSNPDSLAQARSNGRASREARAQLQASVEELRNRTASLLRKQRLQELIAEFAPTDTAELLEVYDKTLYRATADVVYLPCSTVSFTPSEAQITAWFKADSLRYTTPTEMRQLGLFIWAATASPSDSSLVISNVRAFVGMINGAHDQRKRDSIWNGVAKDVESLQVRLHPDSAAVREFYDLVRSTRDGKPGTCIGPVFHPLGIHVLLVDSVLSLPSSTKEPTYVVRAIIAPVQPGQTTTDSLIAEVRTAAQMFADGKTPIHIAETFRKPLTVSPWISPTDKLYDSYRLVQAAFEVQVGGMTEPVDTPDSGFVLAIVMDSIPAGPMPVEAARSRIIADIQRDYACTRLERQAQSMRAVCTVLDDGRLFVAEQLPGMSIWRDQTLDGSGFVGPEVFDMVASLAIRRSSSTGLIGPFRGDAGWYVVNITTLSKSSSPPFAEWLQGDGSIHLQQQRQAVWERWLMDVRSRATIVDLRKLYFRY